MSSKPLTLSLYESSLLSDAGLPLADGWQAIAETHSEPEVRALFSDLHNALRTRTLSFIPFEQCPGLRHDLTLVCHFAELAAVSTMYAQAWSDMTVGLLLKQKLTIAEPTQLDVALATHLLLYGDSLSGNSLREELHTWSTSPRWVIPEAVTPTDTFPEAWWEQFSIEKNRVDTPPTIGAMVKASLESGKLELVIPDIVARWSRILQVAELVYR